MWKQPGCAQRVPYFCDYDSDELAKFCYEKMVAWRPVSEGLSLEKVNDSVRTSISCASLAYFSFQNTNHIVYEDRS